MHVWSPKTSKKSLQASKDPKPLACGPSHHPSKHVGSDSEACWSRQVMAIMVSVQPELSRVRLFASDLVLFFQRRPGSYWANLARILSGRPGQALAKYIWSGFGRIHLVWKQAGVQESPGLYLAERNQPSASFPEMAWNRLCKISPDLIWF